MRIFLAGATGAIGRRLMPLLLAARECRTIHVTGLMLLPPATEAPEAARPYFAALRNLRDDLVTRGAKPSELTDLSMGMSHDFEVAVEEGATMVRLGTAVFGARQSG